MFQLDFSLHTCPALASLAPPCCLRFFQLISFLPSPVCLSLSPPAPRPLVSLVCVKVQSLVCSLPSCLLCLPVPAAHLPSLRLGPLSLLVCFFYLYHLVYHDFKTSVWSRPPERNELRPRLRPVLVKSVRSWLTCGQCCCGNQHRNRGHCSSVGCTLTIRQPGQTDVLHFFITYLCVWMRNLQNKCLCQFNKVR